MPTDLDLIAVFHGTNQVLNVSLSMDHEDNKALLESDMHRCRDTSVYNASCDGEFNSYGTVVKSHDAINFVAHQRNDSHCGTSCTSFG